MTSRTGASRFVVTSGYAMCASLGLALSALPAQSPTLAASQDQRCVGREADVPGTVLQFSVGGSVTAATSNAQTFSTDAKLINTVSPPQCNTRRARTLFLTSAKYDQKGKPNSTQSITRVYTLTAQHLRYLKEDDWYASAQGDFLSNNNLGLYLQQTYSVRVGREFARDRLTVHGAVGPALMGQHFSTSDTSTRYAAVSTSEDIAIELGRRDSTGRIGVGPVVSVTYHGGYGALGDAPTYHDAEVAFVVPLVARFGLKATVFGDYLSNVPTGFKNTYLTTTLELQIKALP